MEGAPPAPGDVAVERLARQRVPERGDARLHLDEHAARDGLVEAGSPASSATSARSKRRPATLAASTTRRAPGDSRPARARTASRTVSGTGTSPSPAGSSPAGPWITRPAARKAAHSSSTKKGTPCVRS